MARKPVTGRPCPNVECDLTGERNAGNIVRHSFYKTRDGRRRRYRCKACSKTFSAIAEKQAPAAQAWLPVTVIPRPPMAEDLKPEAVLFCPPVNLAPLRAG